MADLDAECPGTDALVPDPLKLHPFSTQEGHGGTRPRQLRIKFVTLYTYALRQFCRDGANAEWT